MTKPHTITWRGADRSLDWLAAAIRRWEALWGIDLGPLEIRFSRRMTRSFGYCVARSGDIVVAQRLLVGDQALLSEVVCHELAHLATARLHGPGARPHGPEWRALMTAAGFPPRRQLPADRHAGPPRRRGRYLHRCRRCGAARETTRRMRGWRCVACVRAGHSGAVEILFLGWRHAPRPP